LEVMKKFCSKCGNHLELSQRFCSQCGAVNPFFVSTFSFLSDQSDELERLRLEKERIDKELAEKEEKQAEFRKQEQLRREAEETERMKIEDQEKERLAKEQQERDRVEQALKQELLKVKEETELYKRETTDWVKEVRQGLQQIEQDNKQLKEDVANLSKAGKVVSENANTTIERSPKTKGFMISLLVILFGLTSVLAFLYFTTRYDSTSVETSVAKQQVMQKPVENAQSVATDTVAATDTARLLVDTLARKAKTAITPSPKTEMKVMVSETAPPQPKENFMLDEARIRKDLIGKRISGCDIIIGNASEIQQVNNLVLIEKLGSGNLRYRFTAIIAQGKDTYTASPYIYYNAAGAFVKLDGTNCE
jgi:hypothetical protein